MSTITISGSSCYTKLIVNSNHCSHNTNEDASGVMVPVDGGEGDAAQELGEGAAAQELGEGAAVEESTDGV